MRFLSFGGIIVMGIASPLLAAEISVPADYGSIQDAINAAVDGDVVTVGPGTYVGQINFLGKAIVVRSLNPGATIIDAALAGSAVKFDNGEGQDSIFGGFTITNGDAPAGGGIYIGAGAHPSISNCQIEGNQANFGAGMYVGGGVTMWSTTFVGNDAATSGGGVYCALDSNVQLLECRFEGNDAPTGSALTIRDHAQVVNAEIFDNVNGVAVSIDGNDLVSLVNCTVFGNAPGGIMLNGGAILPTTIANCIVRGNGFQIAGPAGLLNVRYSNVGGGFAGPGNINVNPQFVNAAAGDFRLGPASPCIDAGENSNVPLNTSFDIDGIVRLADKSDIVDTGVGTPPIVDIGAHEFPPARRYVKADATGANNGMKWLDAYTDLQDALDEAASGADITEIWVAAGTYKPDRGTGNRGMSFEMLDNVEITGGFAGAEIHVEDNDPAANSTVLSGAIGNPTDADNSYHVVEALGVNSAGKLIGFTVQRGQADGAVVDGNGGGIYIENGAPVIRECWVRLNHALTAGGGIYVLSGDPNIIRTRISRNTCDNAGAGLLLLGGTSQVLNCLFSGNDAGDAAAIYVLPNTTAEITNCTIVGNNATAGQCGGITSFGTMTAANLIIGFNTGTGATTELKQIRVPSGSATVGSCCIEGWTGGLGGTFNFGNAPLFVDANGADNVFGTADDDCHLKRNSPCIDSADADALANFIVVDFDGNDRFLDDAGMPNLGGGAPPHLDRGAYEYTEDSCLGDIVVNGSVDTGDLLDVINHWGACSTCFSDLNADHTINTADLLVVINHWGVCP